MMIRISAAKLLKKNDIRKKKETKKRVCACVCQKKAVIL